MRLAPPPDGKADIITKAVFRAFTLADLENRMAARIEVADFVADVRHSVFYDGGVGSEPEYSITVVSHCWGAFVRCGAHTRTVLEVLFGGDYPQFERHAVLLSLA